MLKRLLGPANRRVRLVVGLMLVGLFCLQCIGPHDQSVTRVAQAVDGREDPRQAAQRLRKLAQTDPIAFLEYCLNHTRRKYQDYRLSFIKQERINGVVGKEQHVKVKFRSEPFSVAMAWVQNPPQGDRLLYVEGKWGNEMLVRPTGALAQAFVRTALRDPNGPEAMKSTLRPVNMFGFERSLENLLEVYKKAREQGDLRTELLSDADVRGRRTYVLSRYLPDGRNYPACKTLVYIDQETLLPIMVEGFGWQDDDFLCRYLYTDIEFNVGLTDDDFRPEANGLVSPKQ